ncbi:Xaa-Pro peptidase family protein [Oscillospiraceae bacterium PP1C4]
MKSRVKALLSRLPEEIDAVLITSEVNRLYFTGMHSSAGTVLLIKDAGAYFIIDFRYIEKAKIIASDCEVILQGKLYEQLGSLLAKHGVKTVGVESDYMTVSDYLRFNEKLSGVAFVMNDEVSGIIRRMRMIKSAEELANIKAAQKISDEAFTHICGYIKAGQTDREIACELLDYTYRQGSEHPAFDFIVVSGKNGSMPHGVPSEKVVERGDFITMDFGCVVNGYCSDMTRTVAVGEIGDEQRLVYDTVLKAQLAAIAAVREGTACSVVDAAARDLIAAAGYGDCFGHGTGHSLGIEIHESPAFSPADATLCKQEMVITVEPGIYLEGKFGVRIEDMVRITADGCENLTDSNKQLVVL